LSPTSSHEHRSAAEAALDATVREAIPDAGVEIERRVTVSQQCAHYAECPVVIVRPH
jgi:hypothetical protein